MKVLLSTTLGHNPGDEIIAQGVKNLLLEVYGPNIQYINYNRNPDLQEGDHRLRRLTLVGNYLTSESLLSHVDMVVLAGSPEWYGGPMKSLYEAITKYNPHIPLLALGIGLGHQWGTLTELDKQVLSRPETKIITRSEETTAMLLKEGIKSKAMVCPALFAFDQDLPNYRNGTILILQKPGYSWHEVNEATLTGPSIMDLNNAGFSVLCLHVKEFEYYSNLGIHPQYAGSPDAFASIVSRYRKVVSTRLHGAIGALSLGIPAVVVSNGNFRIETCASMFGSYLPVASNVAEGLEVDTHKVIQPMKDKAREAWLKELYILSSQLDEMCAKRGVTW